MLRVLAIPATMESARKLGYPAYESASDLAEALRNTDDRVLRWGSSYESDRLRGREVGNDPAVIKGNLNKLESLSRLGEVVKAPRVFRRNVPAGVKVVVRPIEHTRGEDFQIRTGPFRLEEGTYGAEYFDTRHEYRVWFAYNRFMAAYRTAMRGQSGPNRAGFGYEFTGCGQYLTSIVRTAANELGFKTGAADVLCLDGQRDYAILEINSAPALDQPRVLQFFKDAILEGTGIRPFDREAAERELTSLDVERTNWQREIAQAQAELERRQARIRELQSQLRG